MFVSHGTNSAMLVCQVTQEVLAHGGGGGRTPVVHSQWDIDPGEVCPMKTLGVDEQDQTFMQQLTRGEGLIRTPDLRLAKRLQHWQGQHLWRQADYFVALSGQFLYRELRFPMRMWKRVAKAAGFIPRPEITPAQRRARRANAAKARAALRRKREGSEKQIVPVSQFEYGSTKWYSRCSNR